MTRSPIHAAWSLFLKRLTIKRELVVAYTATGDETSPAQLERARNYKTATREFNAAWCKAAPVLANC